MAKILEPVVDLAYCGVRHQERANIEQPNQDINDFIAMIDDCSDGTYPIKSD